MDRQTKITIHNSPHIRFYQKNNITKNQKKALTSLHNDPSIIIKPADKGGRIVVQDKHDYVSECLRQLSNPLYYTPIDTPLRPTNILQIYKILQNMIHLGIITRNQSLLLLPPDNLRDRFFYTLPKIHKHPSQWPQPNIPEGRPIISNCSTETKNICTYLNYYIAPLATLNPTYLKDSYQFKNKITNISIPPNSYLVSADVTSLYTNMNLNRTIAVITRQLNLYPAPNRPDKFLIQLLTIILKNNDFLFNNQRYLQILGMAMGVDFAPSAANLYLLNLDQQALNYFITPILFFRYIDDLFWVWDGTEHQLQDFHTYLNSIIPGITLKLTYHKSHLNFLDTTVFKHINPDGLTYLHTKIFFKTTDTHQLLHPTSFHPPTCHIGVLKSQLIRFFKLSTNPQDYFLTSKILYHALSTRNYNWTTFKKIRNQIFNRLTNHNTLKTVPNTPMIIIPPKKIFPLVFPYSNFSSQLTSTIRTELKDYPYLTNHKIIRSFSSNRNLQKTLIKTPFP